MSLLPGQVPPPNEPFVTLNKAGDYIIEQNWWLFLLNLSQKTLNTSLDTNQVQLLESVNLDAGTADIPGLARQIANLQTQFPESEVITSLRDLTNAIILALTQIEDQPPFNGFSARITKVGLTAVTGTEATAAKSDSAPALDVTISPTWTGAHAFAPAGGAGLVHVNSTTATNLSAAFFDLGGVNKVRFGTEGTAGATISGSGVGDAVIYSVNGVSISGNAGGLGIRIDNTNAIDFHAVATTTTAPAAGGAGALPATPAGYATFSIGGTPRKIPFY